MSVSDDVRSTVSQWLARTQLDREDARILFANRSANFGNVAVPCQQAVEKLIKAYLVRHAVRFPKIHNTPGSLRNWLHHWTPIWPRQRTSRAS